MMNKKSYLLYFTTSSEIVFLTSPRCGAILIAGAEYTLGIAVAIPTASGLFSCLIVFYGWGAPNRKAGGMAIPMYSTPRPPYALNKQTGGFHSRIGDDTMSKSALMPVEFHGTTLTLINRDGKPYVAIKPICDAISIDWSAQYRRIERNPVLKSSVAVMAMQLNGDTQQRDVMCLPLSMLNGWLFGINANRVKNPVIRQKLIEYQFECYDALNNYWAGKTVHPVLDAADLTNLATLCTHMRFLCGWWHQYEPAVSRFNKRVAVSVDAHFIDGVVVAGILEHKHRLQTVSTEYVRNYPFHEDYHYQNQYYLAHGRKETA